MGYILLITAILLLLFGGEVALGFLGILWFLTKVFLIGGGAFKAFEAISKKKIGSAICWIAAAVFFWCVLT